MLVCIFIMVLFSATKMDTPIIDTSIGKVQTEILRVGYAVCYCIVLYSVFQH